MLTTDHDLERRVLVLAPCRRDAEVTLSLFDKAGLIGTVCEDLPELLAQIERGAGAVLLTEEVLALPEIDSLVELFNRQPDWSDLAVILLMHGGVLSSAATKIVQSLGNVTLLERPSPMRSVISAVLTAVRGRLRQYHLREQFEIIRKAEVNARELQQQLEITIDASDLGTFHCPIPLGPVLWNDRCKAHFWLPSDAEIDLDLFYSRIHPDDRERTRIAVEATVFKNQPYDIEYRTVSPVGEIRWIRATGRTTHDELGNPCQFNGTTQDITQRKLSEEGMREADRRKDVFLATLAHELHFSF